MLVACSLVNLTTWEQARPAHRWIMRTYTIRSLAACDPQELHEALQPLGLWRRRSHLIVAMAIAWLHDRPTCYDDVLGLPGCGRYAADSWAIFIEGNLSVTPMDGKLNWYLEERRDG